MGEEEPARRAGAAVPARGQARPVGRCGKPEGQPQGYEEPARYGAQDPERALFPVGEPEAAEQRGEQVGGEHADR